MCPCCVNGLAWPGACLKSPLTAGYRSVASVGAQLFSCWLDTGSGLHLMSVESIRGPSSLGFKCSAFTLRGNLGLCGSFFKVDLNDCKRLQVIMTTFTWHGPSLWDGCYPPRPLRTRLSPCLRAKKNIIYSFGQLDNHFQQLLDFCHARLSLMSYIYIQMCALGAVKHRRVLCIQLTLVPGISQTPAVSFWNLLHLLPGHKVVFESSGGKKHKWY